VQILEGSRDYTKKADVYSFAMLLYYLAAEENPVKHVV
jgi:hypothetical protein